MLSSNGHDVTLNKCANDAIENNEDEDGLFEFIVPDFCQRTHFSQFNDNRSSSYLKFWDNHFSSDKTVDSSNLEENLSRDFHNDLISSTPFSRPNRPNTIKSSTQDWDF